MASTDGTHPGVPPRHWFVALVLLNATLVVGYAALLARDLATRARIMNTDYAVYDTGWSLVVNGDGAHLYDRAAQQAEQARLISPYAFPGGLMAFLNPPHAAVAFAPFAWLDLATGFRLWTALQLVVATLIVRDAVALVGARERPTWWLVVTGVLAFQPMFYAVQLGQFSLLLTWSALRLYMALEAGADARAGFWLFALSLKPQLLPLLVVLIAANRWWRVLAAAAAWGTAAVLASSAVLGWTIWARYVAGVAGLEAFFGQGTPTYMVSLRGLVALALPATTGAYRLSLAVTGAALAAAAVGLAFAWHRAELGLSSRAEPASLARRFALALALALALCPHLFLQDVTLWIAVLVIHWRSLAGRPEYARAFACFALAWPFAYAAISAGTGAFGARAAPLALVPVALAFAWMARAPRPAA
jgi:hypothetical protein